MEKIKAQIRGLIEKKDGEYEVLKITGSIVKEAACKMKSGKGDVSEGYSSDAILNAPDIVFDQLAAVYTVNEIPLYYRL